MKYGRFDVSWIGGGTNTTRISNWLDPNNTGATTTNTTNVANLTLIPDQVFGDDALCTVSNPYSIPNLPAGAAVQWQASPTGIVTINSANSTQTTLTKIADGTITLTAIVSNACSGQIIITKQNIIVGVPVVNFSVEPFDPNEQFCTNAFGNTIKVEPQPINGVNSFQWGYSSSQNGIPPTVYQDPGTYQQDFIFSLGGAYQIYARAENACGLGTTETLDITVSDNCPGGGFGSFFVLSPNPTTGTINISSTNQTSAIREIRVSDKIGTVKKRFTYTINTKSVTINISSLSPDVYFVQIFDGSNWTTKSIIKK